MLTWPCSYPSCNSQSLPAAGNCHACGGHFCKTHNDKPHHVCPTPGDENHPAACMTYKKKELETLLESIRSIDLAAQASSLRPGHTCTVPTLKLGTVLMGGMNVHIPLTFDDGIKWIVRIRLERFDAPTAPMRKAIMESEILTMQALIKGGLKVPEVYVPPPGRVLSSHKSDTNDLDYFFLDFIPGTPCNAPIFEGDATPEQIKNTIYDLAKFQVALSELTFDAMGSLYPSSTATEKPIVGPLISADIAFSSSPYFLGPFKSIKERYLTTIDYILSHIEGGGSGMFADEPIPAYLVHLELKTLITNYDFPDDGNFYIKHSDDKGDHIMVDREGHITGILDWEWAYTTSKADAFAAPLATMGIGPFFDASNELSTYDKMLVEAYGSLGRPDLAKCVESGMLYHRITFSIGSRLDLIMLDGLREAMGLEKQKVTEEEWIDWASDRYRENEGLKEVIKAASASSRF